VCLRSWNRIRRTPALVDVTLTLFSESSWYDARNELVEQDDEVFSDVPAVVNVWADSVGGEWDVTVETLFVPEEGTAESARIMEAVDGNELLPSCAHPVSSGTRTYVRNWVMSSASRRATRPNA
jgi:subtilisin-like proprotein convertase family protein